MTNRQTTFPWRRILRTGFFVAATVLSLMAMTGAARAQEPKHSLELSRTVRPWEFLPVTGMLAGTLTVRPESSTILYAGDTFAVRETLFVPVHEEGAVILLDVETEQPFE